MVLPFWRGSGSCPGFLRQPTYSVLERGEVVRRTDDHRAARVLPEDYSHPTPFGKIKSFSIERVRVTRPPPA